MRRSYYSENFQKFIEDTYENITGELLLNDPYSTIINQKNAWIIQIGILQEKLKDVPIDRILFEYTIPRMGKRVDNILFYNGVVYLLEFKIGADSYQNADIKQVEGYASDLKNFQEGSRNCKIVPILICPDAINHKNEIELYEDGVCKPLLANDKNLDKVILQAAENFDEPEMNIISWENSGYNPTPTIIEAGQALYNKHTVKEITRNDSIGETFERTSNTIDKIILQSKKDSKKSIVFLTGIPGSGKTLVGLNVASKYQDTDNDERAVYISGTATLIAILQEALVRDKVANSLERGIKITKKDVRDNQVKALFQYLLHYRKEVINFPDQKPSEKIVIFDEAQRMWNQIQLDKEIGDKLKHESLGKSETDLLIEHMDKHENWAVIICLIGGGQEIHKGEDGIIEWLKSVKKNFPHWHIYFPPEIKNKEYLQDAIPEEVLDIENKTFMDELHLKTSTRSFKAENFSKFINHLLARETAEAKTTLNKLEKFPLKITRDLQIAKKWVKKKARGNERYGLFTTAYSHRLHPEGIVKRGQKEFNPEGWWLDSEEYVDSSFALEIPCTEFFAQGLEVDWGIFGWDACFRPKDSDWEYMRFSRKEWKNLNKKEDRKYLKNAFRVLLTRCRQGMVIFIPKGDITDKTRLPEFYNGIYNYLKEIGIKEI